MCVTRSVTLVTVFRGIFIFFYIYKIFYIYNFKKNCHNCHTQRLFLAISTKSLCHLLSKKCHIVTKNCHTPSKRLKSVHATFGKNTLKLRGRSQKCFVFGTVHATFFPFEITSKIRLRRPTR